MFKKLRFVTFDNYWLKTCIKYKMSYHVLLYMVQTYNVMYILHIKRTEDRLY